MIKNANLLAGESIDLSSEIAILNAPQTPLTSLLMQKGLVGPADAVKVEWREKTLDTTNTPAMEGAEPAELASSRALKDNYCQIVSKQTKVSGTVQAVGINGISNMLSDEVNARLIECKRDIEYYSINGTKTAETTAPTPRQMNGIFNQIHSDNKIETETAFITKGMFLSTVEKVWQAGIMGDYYCLTNSTLKGEINNLADSNFQFAGTEQIFGISIAKYVTDFGNVFFILSNLCPTDKLAVGNIDYLQLAELRKAQIQPLAKTGDSLAAMVVWEGALKLQNSKSFASFTKLPTT